MIAFVLISLLAFLIDQSIPQILSIDFIAPTLVSGGSCVAWPDSIENVLPFCAGVVRPTNAVGFVLPENYTSAKLNQKIEATSLLLSSTCGESVPSMSNCQTVNKRALCAVALVPCTSVGVFVAANDLSKLCPSFCVKLLSCVNDFCTE